MNANYWLVQYVPDLLRKESSNVGVIVKIGDVIRARFFGEVSDEQFDGRKLRSFSYPSVYTQWVSYWRSKLTPDSLPQLIAASQTNYRISEGGILSDFGDDSPETVTSYLYSVLVSDGGLREALYDALSLEEGEQRAVKLTYEVADVLNSRALLEKSLAHPVTQGVVFRGATNATHLPEFSQRNGALYIIETVDFTAKFKRRAHDRAGASAYMFADIRAAIPETLPIAVIKANEDDLSVEDVKNGLRMLEKESHVIDWSNARHREQFLEERQRAALATAS